MTYYRRRAFELYPWKCAECGYDLLMGVLEVHHIDFNHSNDEDWNLEILCPTCHREKHVLNLDTYDIEIRMGEDEF